MAAVFLLGAIAIAPVVVKIVMKVEDALDGTAKRKTV